MDRGENPRCFYRIWRFEAEICKRDEVYRAHFQYCCQLKSCSNLLTNETLDGLLPKKSLSSLDIGWDFTRFSFLFVYTYTIQISLKMFFMNMHFNVRMNLRKCNNWSKPNQEFRGQMIDHSLPLRQVRWALVDPLWKKTLLTFDFCTRKTKN